MISAKKLKEDIIATATLKANCHKDEIASLYRQTVLEEITPDESIQRYRFIISDICEETAKAVMDGICKKDPFAATLAQSNLISPRLCGYPEIDDDHILLGGGLYAACYNAITEKIAPREDFIEMNKAYVDIMGNLLKEIQREFDMPNLAAFNIFS